MDAFGEDQYIDLLFFNLELNCLVAVELKRGKFKTSYLGQLQGYLSVLDGFERKPHENPVIGIIFCKDMNKSFVDYVIQDYTIRLAKNNEMELTEKERTHTDNSIVNLQKYLEIQRRIFEEAA